MLGGGGGYRGNFSFGNKSFRHHGRFDPMFPQAELQKFVQWVHDYRVMLLAIGFGALLLILVLTVLFHWLGARGTFGHLDGVATGRYDIGRAWREHAASADSLFRWRLGLGLTFLTLFAAVSIPFFLSVWSILNSGDAVTPERMLFHSGFFLWMGAVLLLLIPAALLRFFLNEFVVPLQYLRRSACGPAAREAWGLVRARPGAFVLYLLLKFVLHLGAAMVVFAAGMVTCCAGFVIMAVPVIGQAILQPVLVFFRAFPLHFLRQFGPEYDLFNPPPGPAPVPPATATA
jgi:hypothetical protein